MTVSDGWMATGFVFLIPAIVAGVIAGPGLDGDSPLANALAGSLAVACVVSLLLGVWLGVRW